MWIVVTEGSCLLGGAACQRVQSDGRVVLELLMDPALGQRQGSSWALDAIEGAPLAARADVGNLSQGVHDIALGVPRSLPLGISVDAISPERITFRLRSVTDPHETQ